MARRTTRAAPRSLTRRVLRSNRSATATACESRARWAGVEPLEDRQLLTVSIVFDYSLDANNFFDTQAKKDLLQLAANTLTGNMTDTLTAITPSSGNTWNMSITNPATGAGQSISNPTIPANTIVIYAGGRNLGGTLGIGGPSGFGASGNQAFFDTIIGRGQAGALAAPATDFSPAGGAITFNTTANWFFGATTSGLASPQNDFLSVALHELGHALGFGTANSFTTFVSSGTFIGAKSEAAHGGTAVPLDPNNAHWAEGTNGGGQEAAMDPTLTVGTRKNFTALDFAGLDDLGWDFNTGPVPDPDDQISEANAKPLLVLKTPVLDSISPDGTDVDMFRFTATAGQRIGFDINLSSGSPVNSFLRIFNSAGAQLALNDDGSAPGEPFQPGTSYVENTFPVAGTYYVAVSGAGNTAYDPIAGTGDTVGSAGTYSLVLTDIDTNDQISEVAANTPLAFNIANNASINPANNDVDLFPFVATAGQKIGFDIDHASGSLNSFLRIFDSAGNPLASNNDGAAPGEVLGTDSYLEFTFASPGTYFLGVSANANTAYNALSGLGDANGASTGVYSITLTNIAVADTDPNDQISEITNTPLVIGAVNNASISPTNTDVDLFQFTATAGQKIGFDIDHASGTLNSFLRIFTAAGVQLASNNDGAAPGEVLGTDSYVEVTFPNPGTYYVGVSANPNTAYDAVTGGGDVAGTTTGVYSLTLTNIAVADTDPNDQISEITNVPLVIGAVNNASISPTNTDVDLFQFTATAGQKIGFDIDHASGTLNAFLRLFDSAGNQLASNNDAAAPREVLGTDPYLEFTFANPGTYYVGVSANPNTSYNVLTGAGDVAGTTTGVYSLTLTNIAAAPAALATQPAASAALLPSADQIDALALVTPTNTRRHAKNASHERHTDILRRVV